MTFESDDQLWSNFISGSQEAFKELYNRYSDILFSFGMRYTTDRELVKDCVHDVFIDLHNYRFTLAEEVSVRFYVLKSFRRKLTKMLRKTASFGFASFKNGAYELSIGEFSSSVEEDIIGDEQSREMLASLSFELNLLPARQREILYLRFKHDLEYDEIANMMQISVPTCRTLVYRGVRQLRQKLSGLPVAYFLFLLSDIS